MVDLIKPHGGELLNLYLPPEQAEAEKQLALNYFSWDLSPRQMCDIELLLNGGFSPLQGFMDKKDYDSVVEQMRLANGTLWSMPIVLDVTEDFAEKASTVDHIALRDPEGVLIATMEVTDIWQADKEHKANKVFGSNDTQHPGVHYLYHHARDVYLGGRLKGIQAPTHYDFVNYRHSPHELRDLFIKRNWARVIAFQTRNPMHRAHVELTFRAAKQHEANLVINPVVGMTKPGDIDHYSRVRCYEHILKKYPKQTTALSILPLAMRMGGPREALWHAILRKNYGFSHLIVGRDHAGPGKDSSGKDFYGPYEAQELLRHYQDELEIEMVPFQMMVYVEEKAEYQPINTVAEEQTVLTISGTEFRRRLRKSLEIPEWFSYPEVVTELRKTYPPCHRQGLTLFFTGLSGAGKSTVANAVMVKLLEMGGRRVSLLDGDHVRQHLSSELGFSKEHRDLNIQRIGYVASEITKHGGIAICAPIAPYRVTRRKVREMIEMCHGGFVEIYIATPLEVCEQRDRKGLYAKARAGVIKDFTGIDDPYEEPEHPELVINTAECSPDEAAQRIILKLEQLGFIGIRSEL